MSELLLGVAERLRAVPAEIPAMIAEVVQENASLIEDMNIAQLQEGRRSDGEILPDYSPTSVFKYGKPPGPIKLFDQGDFYSAISARVEKNGIELDNKDSKAGMLANRYGDEIIGLTDANVQTFIDEILTPGLQDKTYERVIR